MKSDLVKGHLELLLLGVLAEEPRHGYDVIVALRELSDGMFDLAEGSVYPALHRLERLGQVTSSWHVVSGRRRRVYALTKPGRQAMRVEHTEWSRLVQAVEAVMAPRRVSTP